MIKWYKHHVPDGLTCTQDQIFIIPIESGGCQLYCNGEYCIIKEFTMIDLVDRLKTYEDILQTMDFKIALENILKEN